MEASLEKFDPFRRELLFHQDIKPKLDAILLSVGDRADLTEKYVNSLR